MKTIIFEGIATSGKSSLTQRLNEILSDRYSIYVADEEETHVPIMKQTAELHLSFFEELIDRLTDKKPDLLIIERLYLTQAFRAKTDLSAYETIEAKLKPFNPTTIFLKVDPKIIKERIRQAIEHRDSEWTNYVATKGESLDQQAEYYIGQQETQLELLKQSELPYKIYDTSTFKYDDIAKEIVETLVLN